MNKFLKIYQIYFDENQKKDLDYIPYLNENCNVFFENQVIVDLIKSGAHNDCEYFGVVSHGLRDKLDLMNKQWASIDNLANHSSKKFTPAKFESELRFHKPDVMSFEKHKPQDTITFADIFHPNFKIHFQYIVNRIGYYWNPTVFQDIFYCNNFVAKKEVYEKYVNELLLPAMDIMKTMPELMKDSKYEKPLPDNLKKSFGINHYPYHPFLAERFFSYFCHIHKLSCKHF